MNNNLIGYTKYKNYLRCKNSSNFDCYECEIKNKYYEIFQKTEEKFENSREIREEIKEIVKKYFCTYSIYINNQKNRIDRKFENTKNNTKEKDIIIDAIFIYNINDKIRYHATVDILQQDQYNKDNWNLIKIQLKDKDKFFEAIEIDDSYDIENYSYIYNIFNSSPEIIKINKFKTLLINREYICEDIDNIDYNKLFKFVDITKCIKETNFNIKNIKEYNQYCSNYIPPNGMSCKCIYPFKCSFNSICIEENKFNNNREYNMIDMLSLHKLEDENITDNILKYLNKIKNYDITNIEPIIDEIVNNNKISDNDKDKLNKILIETKFTQNKKIFLNKGKINDFIEKIQYPIYFLDYETINKVMPIYKYSKPLQQIPFQFSLHFKETYNSELKHRYFINRNKTEDPRLELIKELVEVINNKIGTVIVYNEEFEKKINEELIEYINILKHNNECDIHQCNKYINILKNINNRVVDLMLPFKERWIYHYKQYGKYTLKRIAEVYLDMSYENDEIKDGKDAMNKYWKFINNEKMTQKEDDFIESALKYCKKDTEILVYLLDFLKDNKLIEII